VLKAKTARGAAGKALEETPLVTERLANKWCE